jgi:uncharacterized protein
LAKPDYQLLPALLAPVFIWPWVPQWDIHPDSGLLNTIALFTLIPVAEEMLFRGWLQGWLLQQCWFRQKSICVSRANGFTSLAFAGAHLWQHAFILLPGYFIVSLVLGHFRERYRGIAVPILLHGYYNLGLLTASN